MANGGENSSKLSSSHRNIEKQTELSEPTLSELWKIAKGLQQLSKGWIKKKAT